MKFLAAVLASAAAGVSAAYGYDDQDGFSGPSSDYGYSDQGYGDHEAPSAIPSLGAGYGTHGSADDFSVAQNSVTYVTEVVSAFTTYCPGATKITHAGTTYTITEATTFTISDCPCTITRPAMSYPTTPGTPGPVATSSSLPSGPTGPGSYQNGTAPIVPYPTGGAYSSGIKTHTTPHTTSANYPIGTGASTPTTLAESSLPTAGAVKVSVLSGGALAVLLGLAVFVL